MIATTEPRYHDVSERGHAARKNREGVMSLAELRIGRRVLQASRERFVERAAQARSQIRVEIDDPFGYDPGRNCAGYAAALQGALDAIRAYDEALVVLHSIEEAIGKGET